MTVSNPNRSVWTVTCKQLVDEPSDHDDRAEFNLGLNGVHSWRCNACNSDEALNQFHEHNAIGGLDDYEITAKQGEPS